MFSRKCTGHIVDINPSLLQSICSNPNDVFVNEVNKENDCIESHRGDEYVPPTQNNNEQSHLENEYPENSQDSNMTHELQHESFDCDTDDVPDYKKSK